MLTKERENQIHKLIIDLLQEGGKDIHNFALGAVVANLASDGYTPESIKDSVDNLVDCVEEWRKTKTAIIKINGERWGSYTSLTNQSETEFLNEVELTKAECIREAYREFSSVKCEVIFE